MELIKREKFKKAKLHIAFKVSQKAKGHMPFGAPNKPFPTFFCVRYKVYGLRNPYVCSFFRYEHR